jgi:glyceraldehyde-3-phosphate dehydrogenase (NADP+)
VTPFNFPLNLVLHKIAPALAARNAVILKPAPQTPLTSLLLGRVLLDAGLPPDALSVLPCRNDVAELLVRDDRVAMLTFTGSAQVGWYLKSCAGKKRVTLELGGNGGVLIDEDCDELPYAAQRACRAGSSSPGSTASACSGSSCTARGTTSSSTCSWPRPTG